MLVYQRVFRFFEAHPMIENTTPPIEISSPFAPSDTGGDLRITTLRSLRQSGVSGWFTMANTIIFSYFRTSKKNFTGFYHIFTIIFSYLG